MKTDASTLAIRYCGPDCPKCAVTRLENTLAALQRILKECGPLALVGDSPGQVSTIARLANDAINNAGSKA